MKISIAVLTYNRKEKVIDALRSAYSQVLPEDTSIEVVVVDNASVDFTFETVCSLFPDAKIIRTHKNLGCPGGRNILYANCTGDVIVNLDDDGQLECDVVAKTIAMFQHHPRAGVIAFKQVEVPGEDKNFERTTCQSNFSGGLSAFRREVIEEVGPYPDDFFLCGEEENLALRVINAGFEIIYAPNIRMIHNFNHESASPKFAFFHCRNTLLNVAEMFPATYVLPYFIGRCLSNFRYAWRIKCISAWMRGTISAIFLATHRARAPVSIATVRFYLKNRS